MSTPSLQTALLPSIQALLSDKLSEIGMGRYQWSLFFLCGAGIYFLLIYILIYLYILISL